MRNGKIDRVKVREIVFKDATKLKQLNAVIHPLVISKIKHELCEIEEGVVVVDAPLLIETGLNQMMDFVVTVLSDKSTCLERALLRGFKSQEVENIMNQQMPLSEKVKYSDCTIENNEGLKEIQKGVDKLWKRMQDLHPEKNM